MVTSNTFIYVLINYFQLLLFFQICWWDSREGGQPAGMIPMDQCHIDPVYKTIWLNAKAGTEFFTGSTDGMVRFFKRFLNNSVDFRTIQGSYIHGTIDK